MGLKGMMSGMGMDLFGLIALVAAFVAFVLVLVWAFSRPRHEMEANALLWRDDDNSASDSNPGPTDMSGATVPARSAEERNHA